MSLAILLLAGLTQGPASCGASSPYDEAWSVTSMLHTFTLCREPAEMSDQAVIWHGLREGDELRWRRGFPWRFVQATVSTDGWTAACGPVDAERLVQPVLAIDPLGQTVVERPIVLAPPRIVHTITASPASPRATVLQVVISDRAELLVVRRTNELWQRFSLANGEELAPVDMYRRLREGGMPAGALLEAAAIEGRPFLVLHTLVEDVPGSVRSRYVLLDADLRPRRSITVKRPYRGASDAYRALRWASRRGDGTLRIDAASELVVFDETGWVTWRVAGAEDGALDLIEVGRSEPADAGSDD